MYFKLSRLSLESTSLIYTRSLTSVSTMFDQPQPQSLSRLLSMVPEIRLLIWGLSLPRNEVLILDPENYDEPGPLQRGDYGAAYSLLQVSKQVYNETLPLLYSRNTIAAICPSDEDNDAFERIPYAALKMITKVELCVDGLPDMGPSHTILTKDMTAVTELRLNFWHAYLWLRPALELAYRSYSEGNFTFKLEMFRSVWARGRTTLTHEIIDTEFASAKKIARLYKLILGSHIKTITLSASVDKYDAYAFATYKHDSIDWRFNKDGNKDVHTVKYLVWEGKQLDDWIDKL